MNLYLVSVPVFIQTLKSLSSILGKAKSHLVKTGMSEETLLNARLAPDMFPFMRQIQIVSDNAKGIAARLTGEEPPKMEDTEQTLDELILRCDKTIAYLTTLKPEAFVGSEERKIPFHYAEGKYLSGLDTFRYTNLPNFFFHAAIAYGILRHLGLEIGKCDFLGELPLQDIE